MTKSLLLPFLLLLLQVVLVYTTQADYYCGYSWDDAALQCLHPCPSGNDSDCSFETTGVVAGDDTESAIYGCYFFTGCEVKTDNGLTVEQTSPAPSIVGGGEEGGEVSPPLETESNGDDVVQGWLSSSPTIIISSYELLRLELIFSFMNIMSTLEIDVAIDTLSTTMFDYITDVLESALVTEQGGEAGGLKVNMTNITDVRLGESFDFVDVYITLDVLFNPYNIDVAVIEDKDTWVVNRISDNLLTTTDTGTAESNTTATATTKTLDTNLNDAGLVPTVTVITVRQGRILEQPTSQESNLVTITGGIINSNNGTVVVSLIPSTYPTTATNATGKNNSVSVYINSTSPSPTIIAAVAIPTLLQPSFGGITSATLPTTLPSLSQVPSLSYVPSLISITATTSLTTKEVEDGNVTEIVIKVTLSLLLLCLVSGGWLYRTKNKNREGGDAGGRDKSFLPITLSSFRANANRKHSLSTRESSNCSIIVEDEEAEDESCQSNEIQEPIREKTPSKKIILPLQLPSQPLPPSRWRRSVMQNHDSTKCCTGNKPGKKQTNELKSSFTSRRRLSSSETQDFSMDLDDLRVSMKGNDNNRTIRERGELKSSPKIVNKNEETKKRGNERSQSANMSSVVLQSSRYNNLSKPDSKIPYYNPGKLKSSTMTAKKKTSNREKYDPYPSNDNLHALKSSIKRSDNKKKETRAIDKNHRNNVKNFSSEAPKSSLLLRSSMKMDTTMRGAVVL